MKEHCISQFLLDLLTCPKGCDCGLQISMECDSVEHGELLCPACKTAYPVISGVPVLFPDKERCDFTTDKALRSEIIGKVKDLEQKIRYLNRDKYCGVFVSKEMESLAWEYFHWQSWEREYGTVVYDKENIDMCLENDTQGGGRLRFFNLVTQHEDMIGRRIILNVGAGRDYLYEEFIKKGACVIEQDIVLDSLLILQKIGALGICCDLRRLPIKSGIIDVVTSFQTLHHVYPIEIPVKEISRVLLSGGGLYINEPNGWQLPVLMRHVLDFMPGRVRAAIAKKASPLIISSSPYEKSIRPSHIMKCLNNSKAFSQLKIMYIHQKKRNTQPLICALDCGITKIIPWLSSHFAIYARKK